MGTSIRFLSHKHPQSMTDFHKKNLLILVDADCMCFCESSYKVIGYITLHRFCCVYI